MSSVKNILQQYGFDGIDLAWQFPLVRVKQRSSLQSAWHKIKKTFGYAKSSKDLQADEHKAGFTALIKELKLAMRPEGHLVTASVIPHTNYSSNLHVKFSVFLRIEHNVIQIFFFSFFYTVI